ncbi:hypothetical protein E4P41_17805 [Geodermatophilus sp. DF01-2]|uniref:hypothetical protein n=1 Tax=Geodermatophilus sp. DF01-2 TaxID=2559610 RepID=UPI0010748F11|nr:hypothetical protein [Geodermatophilus sp. DF01_2]TFV55088.1 hypothetical protein E4P41_17805 [Geodermatophilus sp. DF01_2]
MRSIPTFEEYLDTLGRLSIHVDPTAGSPQSAELKEAAESLGRLDEVSVVSLARWVNSHPTWVPALGLAVGLSQEQLRNQLRHHLGSSGWVSLARDMPIPLVAMLEEHFDVVRLIESQRDRSYDFGDILVARGGTRAAASRAGASGRRIEDEIEAIALDLGLACATRTRFVGRNGRDAPCELVVPDGPNAAIAVAAKGFDSTGSKLSDAVREIEEMADVRQPRQFIMAVIDGIGWKQRQADLRRIHTLWAQQQIDGMYTLATLGDFRADLEEAARLRGLFQL